jgi:uncharacterized Ntn-hydrolase superfamily protein
VFNKKLLLKNTQTSNTMKSFLLSALIFLMALTYTQAQDTFSIVGADSATREVGSAGASCVDLFSAGITDIGFLGDLLPDTGAINTQAYYLAANQNNARARMREGLTPVQIINWLAMNDVQGNSTRRQYGIVGFSGNEVSAAGFTGANCDNYKNHKTGNINGIYYSIQGNILLGQLVIDSMESRFRNAEGDLACRLMAALQGAKMVGADTRCTADGTSSLFAFIKVAQPTDSYGNPSFFLGVRTHDNAHIEPIDSLQSIFDAQHLCETTTVFENRKIDLKIFPDPARNEIEVRFGEALIGALFVISDQFGRPLLHGNVSEVSQKIDITKLASGLYVLQVGQANYQRFLKY